MTPVSRDTQAGRAYLDLRRLARGIGRPTDELLRTYVLERFLWRVAASPYRERLILKGGMLMAIFAERRPTADIDMPARSTANDSDHVSDLVREILQVSSSDGVIYESDQMRVSRIRDEDAYPGVCVSVPARIDRAKALLRIDVNFGEPVTRSPVLLEYLGLLGDRFDIVGYPPETVLAEKIVTVLNRGQLTTRERDFADVYQLIRRLDVPGEAVTTAIDATIAHRGTDRRPIAAAVGALATIRQSNWARYVAAAGLEELVPTDFWTVIQEVAAFADPVIARTVEDKTWVAQTERWTC